MASESTTFAPNWDFFTNFGRYMPRTHCMRTEEGTPDWPWVYTLLVMTALVVLGYLRIMVFWLRSYFAEKKQDRNRKLMDLAVIFLMCAICGYAMSMLSFVWPAYRLLVFFLLILNAFNLRFILRLEDFKVSFSAKRLQRELHEALQSRNVELERLVAERTLALEKVSLEAEQANRAKSEFLANMSHEIRTPMTAILGYAELLGNSLKDPAALEATGIIRRNGDHLLTIINDILDLSKVEADCLEIERIPCELVQLVGEVYSLMRVRAQDKGLDLSVDWNDTIPEFVTGDPTRIKQILTNLIGNAIKFTSVGSVRVEVRFLQDVEILRFDVIDTGLGLSPDQADRLFKPFAQADQSTTRCFGGSGLGLTISQRLARRMGGDVELIYSQPGLGAHFRTSLSAVPPIGTRRISPPPIAHVSQASAPPTSAAAVRIECRILLAEDGPDNQRLIAHILRKAGAEVTLAENGQLALEAALTALDRGDPYDVVLTDMQMPVMDGYEATRQLRARHYTGPIVALTANAMATDKARCLASGCDDYLTKPIDSARLIRTVRQQLDRPQVKKKNRNLHIRDDSALHLAETPPS